MDALDWFMKGSPIKSLDQSRLALSWQAFNERMGETMGNACLLVRSNIDSLLDKSPMTALDMSQVIDGMEEIRSHVQKVKYEQPLLWESYQGVLVSMVVFMACLTKCNFGESYEYIKKKMVSLAKRTDEDTKVSNA